MVKLRKLSDRIDPAERGVKDVKMVPVNAKPIRDFIDLFFILRKTGLNFDDIADLVIEKYGVDQGYDYHLKTSFVYFDDAEIEMDQIIMLEADDSEQRNLARKEWEEMKTFFLDLVK